MFRKLLAERKIRYLLAGGWNVVFGYGVFALLYMLVGSRLHYLAILTISHVLAVTNAFFSYRLIAFQDGSGGWRAYFRFNLVYVGVYFINAIGLYYLVGILHMGTLVAQGILFVLTTVSSYLLHSRFSFSARKRLL